MGTGGLIMPFSIAHMETACRIKEDQVIHPFAFRTHTHSLGMYTP
jgi:peptidylglycine monooxygenase